MKILPILIAAAIVSSCAKNQTATQTTDPSVAMQNPSATTADSSSTSVSAQTPTPDAQNTINSAGITAATGKPALNPAHGEPFHRCDIAVGAPIDSAPQQAAAPQNAPQTPTSFNTNPISPAVTSSAAPAQAIGPKPALNPAHGEPHHRCDLQVGSPLT